MPPKATSSTPLAPKKPDKTPVTSGARPAPKTATEAGNSQPTGNVKPVPAKAGDGKADTAPSKGTAVSAPKAPSKPAVTTSAASPNRKTSTTSSNAETKATPKAVAQPTNEATTPKPGAQGKRDANAALIALGLEVLTAATTTAVERRQLLATAQEYFQDLNLEDSQLDGVVILKASVIGASVALLSVPAVEAEADPVYLLIPDGDGSDFLPTAAKSTLTSEVKVSGKVALMLDPEADGKWTVTLTVKLSTGKVFAFTNQLTPNGNTLIADTTTLQFSMTSYNISRLADIRDAPFKLIATVESDDLQLSSRCQLSRLSLVLTRSADDKLFTAIGGLLAIDVDGIEDNEDAALADRPEDDILLEVEGTADSDGRLTFAGKLTNWVTPFGVPHLTLDEATLRVVADSKPGAVSVAVTSNISVGESTISANGTWSPEEGFSLNASFSGNLPLSDIALMFHRGDEMKATGDAAEEKAAAMSRFPPQFQTSGLVLQEATLAVSSAGGFSITGKLLLDGKSTIEASFAVTATFIEFNGSMSNVNIDDTAQVDSIKLHCLIVRDGDDEKDGDAEDGDSPTTSKLSMELNGVKFPSLLKDTAFTGVAYLAADEKAIYVQADRAPISLSSIDQNLKFLDLEFKDVRCGYMKGPQSNKEGILLDSSSGTYMVTPGLSFSGTMQVAILHKLLGDSANIRLTYANGKFDLSFPDFVVPKALTFGSSEANSGRLDVDFDLEGNSPVGFRVFYTSATFTLFNSDNVQAEVYARVPFTNPQDIGVGGKVFVTEGKGVRIGEDLFLTSIEAEGSIDSLRLQGTVAFGNRASVTAEVRLSKTSPAAFWFSITDTTFGELIGLVPKLVGLDLPTPKFLDQIVVHCFSAAYAPPGAELTFPLVRLGDNGKTTTDDVSISTGFAIAADMTIFGQKVVGVVSSLE